ncbi:hypothetical protein RHMOL_Rhmol01G0161100 [Rhododendron molle]|uniref:Uncharacterized protein n=1 Tax=Rhododendron molle TaxID=49168 RepID=A0ACC0Q3D1_RHOML|nr:hypothetical protein RHMOL_Rhmol01G0161100 [Rhododendron molle]
MADHSDGSGGGEVIDRPENRGSSMAVEETDPTAAEPTEVEGAMLTGGGDGEQRQQQEAAGGEVPRAVVEVPRARD